MTMIDISCYNAFFVVDGKIVYESCTNLYTNVRVLLHEIFFIWGMIY